MNNVNKLSHIALLVNNIDDMIEFYNLFAEMEVIHRRIDDGVNVAWVRLGDSKNLTIVMIETNNINTSKTQRVNHFGFDAISKESVDKISELAKQKKCLKYPAQNGGKILGYFCMVEDPNGNNLEFAYGQMRTDEV
ncbi:MAG: VOC family protein [Candidatus Sericytochromatia bacterium]